MLIASSVVRGVFLTKYALVIAAIKAPVWSLVIFYTVKISQNLRMRKKV